MLKKKKKESDYNEIKANYQRRLKRKYILKIKIKDMKDNEEKIKNTNIYNAIIFSFIANANLSEILDTLYINNK